MDGVRSREWSGDDALHELQRAGGRRLSLTEPTERGTACAQITAAYGSFNFRFIIHCFLFPPADSMASCSRRLRLLG